MGKVAVGNGSRTKFGVTASRATDYWTASLVYSIVTVSTPQTDSDAKLV